MLHIVISRRAESMSAQDRLRWTHASSQRLQGRDVVYPEDALDWENATMASRNDSIRELRFSFLLCNRRLELDGIGERLVDDTFAKDASR